MSRAVPESSPACPGSPRNRSETTQRQLRVSGGMSPGFLPVAIQASGTAPMPRPFLGLSWPLLFAIPMLDAQHASDMQGVPSASPAGPRTRSYAIDADHHTTGIGGDMPFRRTSRKGTRTRLSRSVQYGLMSRYSTRLVRATISANHCRLMVVVRCWGGHAAEFKAPGGRLRPTDAEGPRAHSRSAPGHCGGLQRSQPPIRAGPVVWRNPPGTRP